MQLPWAEDGVLGEHHTHPSTSSTPRGSAQIVTLVPPLTPDPAPRVPFPAFPKNNRQEERPALQSQEEIQSATARGEQQGWMKLFFCA